MKQKRKKVEKNPQARRWCFTLYPDKLTPDFFNIKETKGEVNVETKETKGEIDWETIDTDVLESLLFYNTGARGLAYSFEAGDTKEHTHIQGYIEFGFPIRFKRLQALIGMGVHLEASKGSRGENFDYIFHAGEHSEKGTLYYSQKVGEWPETSGSEYGCYGNAIAMILDGYHIQAVALAFGGAILPQIGNLIRLKGEVDKERISYLHAAREVELRLREEKDNQEIPF